MKPFELAECIARDATCAQGEFNQRVLAIIPYLNGPLDEIDRLQAAKRRALAIADERSKENVGLRAALKKHGGHTSGCRWRGGFDCDCGWSDLEQNGDGK